MKMNEIAVKVAVGAITAMAAGVGSILGSEGAKAGIKALMNRKTEDEIPTPDATPVEIPAGMTDANPEFMEETPTNEVIVEETAEVETEELGA